MGERIEICVKRNGFVDGLRVCFALIIVVYHFPYGPAGGSWFPRGYLANEFFFLISGYFMARKAASLPSVTEAELGLETWRYVGCKIKNILPLFLLSYIPAFVISAMYSKFLNPAYSIIDIGNNLILSLSELSFVSMSGFVTYLANGVSWFFSALFLSTAILYPILRRHYHIYVYILAPLFCVFSLGYISQTYGNLNMWIQDFNGFYYPGMLRALVGVSLGTVAYEISLQITVKIRWWVPVCLHIAAMLLMVVPFTVSNHDFLTLGILFAAVVFTFCVEEMPVRFSVSQRESCSFQINSNSAWMQKLSAALILNHIYVFCLYECIGLDVSYLALYMLTVFGVSCGMLILEQRILSSWRPRKEK